MSTSDIFQVDRHTGRTRTTDYSRMDAIASGVQARFEESTGYSKKVTDETINVARALGVADREIEKWATHRLSRIAQDTERLREIKILLNRVYDTRLGIMARNMRS